MGANPVLGLIFHWLGGLASASFYVPYRGVRRWSWETYWLAGGFMSWIIAPIAFALIFVPHPFDIIRHSPIKSVEWGFIFGALWGLGGLTFGLTMRYLGIALGMAIALSYCAVFGTLMPPLVAGQGGTLVHTTSGLTILGGMLLCVVGIAITGYAGTCKEKDLSSEQKQSTLKEFNFRKGMLVATFSGIMSSCFAYGLAAGKPIGDLAKTALVSTGRSDLWQNLPVLVVVLLGGFLTNSIWCAFLHVRNRSGREYFDASYTAPAEIGAMEAVNPFDESVLSPSREQSRGGVAVAERPVAAPTAVAAAQRAPAPLLANYALCAVAGLSWYLSSFSSIAWAR